MVICSWNDNCGLGGVVLSATTVQSPGRPEIFGLITTTGRIFTISGNLKSV